MRTCVFIDGENFRRSIVELFGHEFNKTDYLPKAADWTRLFDWLTREVTQGQGKRLRTYWYVIADLDFFPYKFPSEVTKLKRLLDKHEPYQKQLESLEGDILKEEMCKIVTELKRKKERMRERFEGWKRLQNDIAVSHTAIEFRRAGAILFDLFTGKLGKEKAVDVKLAVDLISLSNNYDLAVIVAGDQDYVPAVQYVKDMGKRVINVGFLTRGGRRLPGGAWRLNQITDWRYEILFKDLQGYLNL